MTCDSKPRILVFSSLFPNKCQPSAGLFIRERMFRVAAHYPLIVVSPKPWFPFQSIIRRIKPGYRPMPDQEEIQDNIHVYFPRFLSFPSLFRALDGLSMAVSSWFLLRKLKREYSFNVIDAHFAYPDGYAATRLGRWFKVPVTITLRGTEVRHSQRGLRRPMLTGLHDATHIFSVANSLKQHVVSMGVSADKIQVVGNGVDTERFYPLRKNEERRKLGIKENSTVLISVGGLVERKGFHRVIECLPELLGKMPDLHYLIVGGASGEGDWTNRLKQQVEKLGLSKNVHFLGIVSPDALNSPLSAADVFVLSTRNEGWANVFLEAMACGLPVVTTRVGGNPEVVCRPELGMLVPFGDQKALQDSLQKAMDMQWDRKSIQNYAIENSWSIRVDILIKAFNEIVASDRVRNRFPQSKEGSTQ